MKKQSNISIARCHIKSRQDHFWHKGNIPRYETMREFLSFLETRKRMSKKQLDQMMTLGIDMELPKIEMQIIYT